MKKEKLQHDKLLHVFLQNNSQQQTPLAMLSFHQQYLFQHLSQPRHTPQQYATHLLSLMKYGVEDQKCKATAQSQLKNNDAMPLTKLTQMCLL
jgi:hypothetical protein